VKKSQANSLILLTPRWADVRELTLTLTKGVVMERITEKMLEMLVKRINQITGNP